MGFRSVAKVIREKKFRWFGYNGYLRLKEVNFFWTEDKFFLMRFKY